MTKHKAYMQVDFSNPLACKYMELSLRSFDRVLDIFEIHPIQCVTPDNLIEELKSTPYWIGSPRYIEKNWRPGEIGSFHSNYRMAKRLAAGEKFWVMEHDAYLRPEREKEFRDLVEKSNEKSCMLLGTATEIWTIKPAIAETWVNYILNEERLGGTMTVLHKAVDRWATVTKNENNSVYWPARRYKDPRWVRLTGIGRSADEAHRDPNGFVHTPCTQLVDPTYGASIGDRNNKYTNKTADNLAIAHPDLEIVKLD